jgi:hypothetical protein
MAFVDAGRVDFGIGDSVGRGAARLAACRFGAIGCFAAAGCLAGFAGIGATVPVSAVAEPTGSGRPVSVPRLGKRMAAA